MDNQLPFLLRLPLRVSHSSFSTVIVYFSTVCGRGLKLSTHTLSLPFFLSRNPSDSNPWHSRNHFLGRMSPTFSTFLELGSAVPDAWRVFIILDFKSSWIWFLTKFWNKILGRGDGPWCQPQNSLPEAFLSWFLWGTLFPIDWNHKQMVLWYMTSQSIFYRLWNLVLGSFWPKTKIRKKTAVFFSKNKGKASSPILAASYLLSLRIYVLQDLLQAFV